MDWIEHERALPHIQHSIVDTLQTLRERPLSSLTLRDYRATFDAVSALTTPSPEVTSELFTLNGLPPLFLLVGEQETLHQDADRLVARVKACKGKIQCVTWKDMFHVWPLFANTLLANTLPEGKLALEQIAAYFEKYFARARDLWPQ